MIGRACRFVWREPAFTIPATVSLALGICANAAVFAIVNALWFRPLPIAEPDRVVVVYIPIGAQTIEREVLDTMYWRTARRLESARSFSAVMYENADWPLRTGGELRPIVDLGDGRGPLHAAAVGHRYFDLLGIPITGRTFSPEHDEPAAEPVAILGHRLWTALGANPQLIGGTLETTRGPLRVLGVAPAGFTGIRLGTDVDLWLGVGSVPPFAQYPGSITELIPITVYARLRPGVSLADAQAEVRTLGNRRAILRTLRDVAFPIRTDAALQRQESLVLILVIAAAAVLIVGCANLAALVFSRCEKRRLEFAIQLALGSSRGAIARDIAGEILMIGLLALACGLAVTYWLISSLSTMALPTGLTIGDLKPALDWRVSGTACVVAGLSTLIAVARPLLQMRRTDVTTLLSSSAGSTAVPGLMPYRIVAAGHAALTIVLVILAVHLCTVVLKAFRAPRGFAAGETVFVNVQPRLIDYTTETGMDSDRLGRDYSALLALLQSQPGVKFVAPGRPLIDLPVQPASVLVEGIEHVLPIVFLTGAPEYPQALGLTLLAGRTFADSDRGATGVLPAIVDQRLAERLWGTEAPVGRSMALLNRKFEVVGVVHDVRATARVDREAFLVFSVVNQRVTIGSAFDAVIREHRSGDASIPEISAAVREVFPNPARFGVATANDLIVKAIAGERLGATIFATYGAAATTLALSGLAGLALLTVARSRRALGIRMALGAGPVQLAVVVGNVALLPVVWGTACGVVLTWTLDRILRNNMPEYGAIDSQTYVFGTLVFLLSAALTVLPTLIGLRRLRANEVLRAL